MIGLCYIYLATLPLHSVVIYAILCVSKDACLAPDELISKSPGGFHFVSTMKYPLKNSTNAIFVKTRVCAYASSKLLLSLKA